MGFALPILANESTSVVGVLERTEARSVRISVTDRCDMACVYCRASRNDGYIPADERLDVDHWEQLVRALVASGVRRVRITGGEPLLHRDIVEIVGRIASLGVDDLAMTTNASRLSALARPLRMAGLGRLNISIDSLDPERFSRITRGGSLDEVLEGIDAARTAGYDEIKTNTVVVRGENDDEIEALTVWAWTRALTPRFLEVMGVGEGARLFRTRLVPYREIRDSISHLLARTDPAAEADRGPAKYVHSVDGRHRVGFITGTSNTYCAGCDRLRVTSDGVLRPCLSRNDGVDVSEAIREGCEDEEITEALRLAWSQKPDDTWGGCTEASAADVSMRATGG